MTGAAPQEALSSAVDGIAGALLVVATVGAAWRARRDPDTRTGWALYAIGAGLSCLGQGLVLASGASGEGPGDFGAVSSWLTVLGAPVIGLSLLTWPGAPRGRGLRTRLLLDGTILAGASLFVVWTLFLPDLRAASARSPEAFGFTVASITIAAAFLAVGVMLAVRDPGRLRGPLGLYLGCLGTSMAADLASATVPGREVFFAGHTVDALQLLPTVLLALAPLVRAVPSREPWGEDEIPSRLSVYLPYVPLGVALAVGWIERGPAGGLGEVRSATAVAVGLAMLWRQGMALGDLRTLSQTLEARVRSRTRALEDSQAALVRAQRLDAVGRMAAGVVHDFNNLLTVIRSSTEQVRGTGFGADDQARALDDIEAAAERATQLVRQLLAFARQQPMAPRVLDPARATRLLAPLLERLLGSRHRLVVEETGGPLLVRIDPVQLDRVLTNLVANARDAMVDPGTVTIQVGRATPEVASGPGRDGLVRVAVRDTGSGMPPEVVARLFEPFFTTKGPGRGTGLGLATVYGIVQQSGGSLNVESAPGRGTTFELFLPLVAAEASVEGGGEPRGSPAGHVPGPS